MSVLVVAEHRRGELRDPTLELITAGRELGPVTVAVIARNPEALVAAVGVEGVSEIVTVEVEGDEFDSDLYRRAVRALILERRPRVTLLAATVNSMGYGAAVAAELSLGFASDVHGLALEDGRLVALRSFYGGKTRAELEFPEDSGVLLLLRAAVWPAASTPATLPVPVSSCAGPGGDSRTRHLELVEPAAGGDVDIGKADLILSIGRGVGGEENIELFAGLAAKMGATLAASRPLVDAGWLPAARQVGQSGKTVKPKVYLAFGISGAVQHLSGMKASGTIVAVNTDAEAAIFSVAHYGAVIDVFAVAEELEKLY